MESGNSIKPRALDRYMVIGLLALAACSAPCLGQFTKVADFPHRSVWGTAEWNGRIYVGLYVYSADLPIYRSGVNNDSFSFVRNLGRGESIPRLWVSPDGTTLNALTEADSGQPATHWWTTDPNAQNWSSQNFGSQYRWGTAALVAGNDQFIGVNNRYEPARIMRKQGSGSWQQFGPLATPAWDMLVMDIAVFNGQVYLSGCQLPDYHSSSAGRVVRYNSGTNSWDSVWPHSGKLLAGSYVWDGKLWKAQGLKIYSSTNGTTWNLEYESNMTGSWVGFVAFTEYNGRLYAVEANHDNELRVVARTPGGPFTTVFHSSAYAVSGEFVIRGGSLYLGAGKTGGGGALLKHTEEIDTTPPSVPTNLQATSWGSTLVELTWTASTDNVGVTGYKVFRDGAQVGTSTTPYYLDTGRTASTSYTYRVSAFDAAGNDSGQSSPTVGTTLAYDPQPPSIPSNVQATGVSSVAVEVTWTASTDNRGVLGYKVFRNGSLADTIGVTTSYTDSGLIPDTTYLYTVSAYDGDGNESAHSSPPAGATTDSYCSIDLGTVNVNNLLTHPQNSDGDTTATDAGGLNCRRPVNTGDQYFYFAIDDNFLFDEAGITTYLEVCYFDDQSGSVSMQPQYDSTSGAYTNAAPVNFTNTGKWRTATWTLTNCKFANRQNAEADLRIYVGANSVKIDSVRISTIPFTNYTTVYRDLGDNEVYSGLSHPNNWGGSDGKTVVVSHAGRSCRRCQGSGDNYFYFNVSDAIIYNGNPSTVYLKVEYYDSPGGHITPQYDSTGGAYTNASTLTFAGSNTWKEAYWTLPDARFANNQNGSADFRLYVGTAQNVYIDRVYVSKLPFEEDTEAPSVPTDVQATALSESSIGLTWTASTDNVGVVGYKIYRDGGPEPIGTSPTTSYSDLGLQPETTYSYTVSAYDAAYNDSEQSAPPAVATTHSVDTEPPSVPTNVQATALSSSSIGLTWTASTDNVGVAGYKIYRDGGTEPIGTSPTTSYTDLGLQPETTYSYQVSAYDAAQNESDLSSPAMATTPAGVPTHGLIGWWKMDETSGTIVTDSSGNGRHGILATWPGRSNWTTGAHGHNPEGALSFTPHTADTNNAGITVPNDGYFNHADGFTVAAWIRPNFGVGYGHTIINQGRIDDQLDGWALKRRGGTSNQIAFRVGTWPDGRLTSDVDLTAGTWYHVTGTYRQSDRQLKMYIHTADGTLWIEKTGTAPTGVVNNTGNVNIGWLDPQPYTYDDWMNDPNKNAQGFWNGVLDDVRFYDHALTYTQVLTILVEGGILPTITGHPIDQSKYVGQTATFSVTATDADGYQWQLNDGSGWGNIGGAVHSNYTTPPVTAADDGNQYRCVVWNIYGSVESDPATLTVTVPCTDPVLLEAYSAMTHGAAGDFAIEIDLDEPYAIEPRAGAEHRLEFVFDQEIDITGASVTLSSGAIAGLALENTNVTDDTLVATLAEPSETDACLAIEIGGITDVTGVCEMASVTVYLTMIQGEVDGSPPVNLTDLSIVRAELYQAVTLDNFMSDANADGVINLTDLSLVRDNLYQQAVCP